MTGEHAKSEMAWNFMGNEVIPHRLDRDVGDAEGEGGGGSLKSFSKKFQIN